jgi:hypothetical protein
MATLAQVHGRRSVAIGCCILCGEGQLRSSLRTTVEEFATRVFTSAGRSASEAEVETPDDFEAPLSEAILAEIRQRLSVARPESPATARVLPQEIASFRCSFCGRHRSEVAKLIAGSARFICEACVDEATTAVGPNRTEPCA